MKLRKVRYNNLLKLYRKAHLTFLHFFVGLNNQPSSCFTSPKLIIKLVLTLGVIIVNYGK